MARRATARRAVASGTTARVAARRHAGGGLGRETANPYRRCGQGHASHEAPARYAVTDASRGGFKQLVKRHDR